MNLVAVTTTCAFLFLLGRPVVAELVVVPRANYVIKQDHYTLTNLLFDDGCDMTYDPALVDQVGAAFSVNYTDPGGNGMDAYVSGSVGGKKSGGQWRPGDKTLTGMPVLVGDLTYDFRIRWKVSQENAWDADDKWWATINVIFDQGTETSEPIATERFFDIVIELDRYEQDDLSDRSSSTHDTYWWFARNGDGSLHPFTLNIDGQNYEWGVRYKFFQNQGWKDNKVHVKFIPVDNDNVAPYIDHPLRVFTEAAKDFLQYVSLPALEQAKADLRVSNSSLWVKSIAAGYETYTGSSILKQDELRTITDTQPPVSPTGIAALRSANSAVYLNWDVSNDNSLHGYSVWRSESGSTTFTLLSENVYTNSFVDDTATTSMGYDYYITASDRSYNESPPSAIVSVSAITASPTKSPTAMPTTSPTYFPTKAPSMMPTKGPTTIPTRFPTRFPTVAPTYVPTPSCNVCDNVPTPSMVRNNKTCDTATNLKCTTTSFWINNQFCRQSCFEAGLGYSGDNCCPR